MPINYNEKQICWKSISEFLEVNSPVNLVLAGDLNISLSPNEKKGGQRDRDFMLGFVEEIISNWDLNDLKPKSGRFTWSNHRAGVANISARLDRFLVSSSLIEGQSLVSTKILLKLTSDHHPISLVFEREEELGPIPFRYSPLWTDRVGFFEVVSQA